MAKTVEVVFQSPFPGMDVRHNPEAAIAPRFQMGVRRDNGVLEGLEAPTATTLPSSPVRGEYYHRATQTYFVVCGTSLWKKAATDTAFEPVMFPDGISYAVVPGTGTVRIVPFDDYVIVQAD